MDWMKDALRLAAQSFLNLICIHLHKAMCSSISFANWGVRRCMLPVSFGDSGSMLCYVMVAINSTFLLFHKLTYTHDGQWENAQKETKCNKYWCKTRIIWMELYTAQIHIIVLKCSIVNTRYYTHTHTFQRN